MPPRKKSGEGTSRATKKDKSPVKSSRPQPSTSSKFPNAHFEKTFRDRTFTLLPCRSVDKKFMDKFCPSVSEIIAYYKLDSLVYLERDINQDLVSEFYNNIHQNTNGDYVTRVAKKTIDLGLPAFVEYLACRMPSGEPFSMFPDLPDPLPHPFDDVTSESIYDYFFAQPRPDGLEELDTDFPTLAALRLCASDYILFKVITNCVLPITTKPLNAIRSYHCLMLYGLHRHLDFDIMMSVHSSILYHSECSGSTLYMPYGHIITDWLETLHIDVSKGRLVKMVTQNCRLGKRAFSKSGIIGEFGVVAWKDGRALGELPRDRQAGAAAPVAAEADPDLRWQIAALEVAMARREEIMTAEMHGLRVRMDQHYTELHSQQLAHHQAIMGQQLVTHQAIMGWIARNPTLQHSDGVPPQDGTGPSRINDSSPDT